MKLRSLILTSACLVLAPLGAEAQADDGRSASFRAGAEALVGLRLTRLEGGASAMLGGGVRVGVAPGLSVGGVGWIASDATGVDGDSDSDFRLDVAYGGVLVERRVRDGSWPLTVRLTLGAGTARVSLAGVGTEIGVDNFGVVEPELGVGRSLWPRLELRGMLSYRFVIGVEDVPQVSGSDLRGPSLTLGLVFRSR